MSVVGDNIRALRTLFGEGRDITQTELARIAGVTRETVNKWESGAIGNVRTTNIDRLREHFDLSVDDLRSESAGLAAKLHAESMRENSDSHNDDSHNDFGSIPLVMTSDLLDALPADAWPLDANDFVEVPSSVAKRHPRAFAFVVEEPLVTDALPSGCCAVADPDVEAASDSIVVARESDGDKPVVRLLGQDDADAQVDATVVWYQAAEELV